MTAYGSRSVILLTFLLVLIMPHVSLARSPATRPSGAADGPPREDAPIAIAIHGGAGTIQRQNMTPELDRAYRQTLEEALHAGHEILARGGTSLEAVEAAILVMEDSPLFNAGKGGVFTNEGRVELDASVMEGHTLRAGAVASVTTIRNPIKAAIAVMNQTPHVLLIGEGAEKFAADAGLEIVENEYFHTDRRRRALEEAQRLEAQQGARVIGIGEGQTDMPHRLHQEVEGKFGTVGCVALDKSGNLAAGTSTGGLTNKRFGRVGDTPIVGAGNFADNGTCAVSGTGQGEFFIRLGIAGDVAARMRYAGESLENAAAVQMHRLGEMNAQGGLIAMSKAGRPVFVFNTAGMYRGLIGIDGKVEVAIYGDGERIPGDHAANGGTDWGASFR